MEYYCSCNQCRNIIVAPSLSKLKDVMENLGWVVNFNTNLSLCPSCFTTFIKGKYVYHAEDIMMGKEIIINESMNDNSKTFDELLDVETLKEKNPVVEELD
jgi:hypothetical protein